LSVCRRTVLTARLCWVTVTVHSWAPNPAGRLPLGLRVGGKKSSPAAAAPMRGSAEGSTKRRLQALLVNSRKGSSESEKSSRRARIAAVLRFMQGCAPCRQAQHVCFQDRLQDSVSYMFESSAAGGDLTLAWVPANGPKCHLGGDGSATLLQQLEQVPATHKVLAIEPLPDNRNVQ
jgi:hypothetical protein